jgi:hypothetical protein
MVSGAGVFSNLVDHAARTKLAEREGDYAIHQPVQTSIESHSDAIQ